MITPEMETTAAEILRSHDEIAALSLKEASELVGNLLSAAHLEKPRFSVIVFDEEVRAGTILLGRNNHPQMRPVRLERVENGWVLVKRRDTILGTFAN